MSNHDPDTLRHSQVFHRNPVHLYQTSVENGCNQSSFLAPDQTSVECAQKPIRLAAELMFNQSPLLDKQSAGPWSQLQMCNSDTAVTGLEKDPCKVLLDAKPVTETNRVCEKQVPLGLNPATMYPSPTAAQSQLWKQETCTLHQHENCALSAWNQHLDRVRLQLEQIQVEGLFETICFSLRECVDTTRV